MNPNRFNKTMRMLRFSLALPSSRRRTLALISGMLVVITILLSAAIFISPPEAYAQAGTGGAPTQPSEGNNDSSNAKQTPPIDTINSTQAVCDSYTCWAVASVIGFIFSIFRLLAQAFLGIAGYTLDLSIEETVLNMGQFLTDDTGQKLSAAILVPWGVFRDIGNILILFTMVFIGIATILGIDRFGYRQLLARVVIAALFINFSLLIATFVIDVSNSFAANIYSAITIDCPKDKCPNEGDTAGISTPIVHNSWIKTIDNPEVLEKFATISGDNQNLMWAIINISATILFLVVGFIFFAAAFMLVARFVMLIILMITSPIGFAGLALPYTQDIARKWWTALFHQAIFAPVFLFFVWLALFIMQSVGDRIAGPNKNFAMFFAGSGKGYGGVLITFAIVIVLFAAALIMANRLGIHGAGKAVSMGRAWSRTTGKFVAKTAHSGTAGLAIRTGVGGGARLLRGGYEKLDAKMSQRVEAWKERGRLGKAGAFVVGGALNIAHEGVTKGAKKVESQKFGTFASHEERRKWAEEQKKQRKEVVAEQNREKAEAELTDAIKFLTAATDKEREAILEKINRARPKGQKFASVAHFQDEARSRVQNYQDIARFAENADTATQKMLAHENIASLIPKSRFDKIVENDKIDIATKRTMAQNRLVSLRQAIQNVSAPGADLKEIQKVMRNYAPPELLKLEASNLREMAHKKLLEDTRILAAIVNDAASVGKEEKLHAIYRGIVDSHGGDEDKLPDKLKEFFNKGAGIHFKP